MKIQTIKLLGIALALLPSLVLAQGREINEQMDIVMVWSAGLEQFQELGADNVEGIYFGAQYWHEVDTPMNRELVESVKAKYDITPNYPLLGSRVGDDFVYYTARGLAYQQQGAPRFELPYYASLGNGEVVRITCWPGMAAWQLESWLGDPRVKGALLQLWGAGNLGENPDVLEVLASASGEGKLLAATSQCPSGSIHLGAYSAGHGVFEAGVMSGADMTAEAAYTKLVHLLAQPLSDKQRRTLFVTSLIGERP